MPHPKQKFLIRIISSVSWLIMNSLVLAERELYFTDFEDAPSGDNELVGYDGWNGTSNGRGSHGIEPEAVQGLGQSAFIGYNSPGIMDGIGISPSNLTRMMENFPQMIGIKDASHNWETFLELGRAARKIKPNFGLFVGTEWMIPSLTLGGNACMSVFGGIAPNFVKSLYEEVKAGKLDRALEKQFIYSELYQIIKQEYPAPTKAMWEIMGRPVGDPRLPQRPASKESKLNMEKSVSELKDRRIFKFNELI